MEKSRDAFRTISEVAEWLDVPTHVLRFWESRFSQIKPVKRAGGRRYYRPSDMRVIGGVKTLLHDQGMTIRGVQKLFREQGIKHVSSHAPALYGEPEEAPLEEVAVVEHAELETAAPAPSARSTRDAAPDPIIDDAEPAREDSGATDIEEQEPELQFVRATPSSTPEDAGVALLSDAPAIDPDDDDAAYASGPSVAAQLRTLSREKLAAHTQLLASAVQKLKELQERAG